MVPSGLPIGITVFHIDWRVHGLRDFDILAEVRQCRVIDLLVGVVVVYRDPYVACLTKVMRREGFHVDVVWRLVRVFAISHHNQMRNLFHRVLLLQEFHQ